MLVDDIRAQGIELRSYSEGQYATRCPQCSDQRKLSHQRKPCLSVKIDYRGACWSCHNCGWEGYVLEGMRNYAKPAAPVTWQPAALPGDVYKYMQGRGISMATLDAWGLGWDEQTRSIMFPYREHAGGEVVSVKYRDGAKRFSRTPGAPSIFYGLDKLDHSIDTVVIVEGEIDALSLAECGIPNVLSVPDGAPIKVSEHPSDNEPKYAFLAHGRQRLADFSRIVLAVDNDQRGAFLQEEMARRLGFDRCHSVTWPDQCKDANDTLAKHGREAVLAALAQARPVPVRGVYSFDDFAQDLDEFYAVGTIHGTSTGYYDLDAYYTVRPGELTILTGAPHQGKSQLIDNIAYNLAVASGQRFLFVSMEKPLRMHFRTLAQIHVGKPFSWEDFGDAAMTREEMRAARGVLSRYFRFLDQQVLDTTVDNIVTMAGVLASRGGLNGVVVDPYAYIRRDRDQSETDFVSDMLVRLKAGAERHGYHVWVVAHPYKLVMAEDVNPEPNPYQISGSAHWYNLGDNILTVTRWEEGVSKVRAWKNRTEGSIGSCYLDYDKVTGRYSDKIGGPMFG